VRSELIFLIGHHDPQFRKGKEHMFNSNTLKNAENHLSKCHVLDEGGDIWRARYNGTGIQASGVIDGGYERVIPFRQREFKNAFLEWIILDNVKHRKAASKRLKRAFKIANMHAASSIPSSLSIVTWIHELFEHFEPVVIHEIANARSKISITFDGWGSKHEKISVVGVVVHFINENYENVTRLIGLPELPGHRKAGVGT
jgi:hypothetical protein